MTSATIDAALAAVANLTPNAAVSQPVSIIFDLGGADLTGQNISVPAGVTRSTGTRRP